MKTQRSLFFHLFYLSRLQTLSFPRTSPCFFSRDQAFSPRYVIQSGVADESTLPHRTKSRRTNAVNVSHHARTHASHDGNEILRRQCTRHRDSNPYSSHPDGESSTLPFDITGARQFTHCRTKILLTINLHFLLCSERREISREWRQFNQ